MKACVKIALTAVVVMLSGCQALDKLDKEVETWGPEGSGLQFSKLPLAVKILATYKATPKQKAAAREIGLATQAKLLAEQQAATPEPKKVDAAPVEAPAGIQPPPLAPEVAGKPKLPVRVLAIKVPAKEDEPQAQAKEHIILWDTQTEQIVGEDVYVIDQPQKVGSVTKWDTFSAQYVGAGL